MTFSELLLMLTMDDALVVVMVDLRSCLLAHSGTELAAGIEDETVDLKESEGDMVAGVDVLRSDLLAHSGTKDPV